MKYVIGRYINNISINGLEYLLDDKQKEMTFHNRDDCAEYIKQNVLGENPTEEDINDLIWEKEE